MPYSYEQINLYNSSISPSTVHTRNDSVYRFFCRKLLNKVASVYKINVPAEWPKDYLIYNLILDGHVVVFKTAKYGVIPQVCTLSGFNVFRLPSCAVVANPLLDIRTDLEIGKNCELIKFSPDYMGVGDIIDYYANIMALAYESMGISVVNSKISYIFEADNKANAEAFKKMYDQINRGEPATFVGKQLYDESGNLKVGMLSSNPQQTYIADKLADLLKYLENEFSTDVGLPNSGNLKNQRMLVDEVNSNNVETQSVAELRMESVRDGFDRVNAVYGKYLSRPLAIDWRYPMAQNPELMPKRATTAEEEAYNYDSGR